MKTLVSHESVKTNRFSKQRRPFLEPLAFPKENPRFEPPPITNNVNLIMPLRIIVPEVVDAAKAAGKLVFNSVGDSGGIHGDETQVAVAEAMEEQIKSAAGANKPAFLYHLGDVIYFNGQSNMYTSQFYEPYKYYPAPIFAVPGNHDGDTIVRRNDPVDPEPSLYGFVENFCATQLSHISPYRGTMTQPYVYWTLAAPLVTIIGLYSNVEGTLDARGTYEQQKWLEDQLKAVPSEGFLLIAVHHPPYSLDSSHGGSPDIALAIDHAIAETEVIPHAVLSGHVHCYQRFTRRYKDREIPYIVDGRGGYANSPRAMHKLQKDGDGKQPTAPIKTDSVQQADLDLTLESYDDENPGFLRVTVTKSKLTVDSFTVPFVGEARTQASDSVTVKKNGMLA
jgi:hypothetical protein